MDRDKKLLQRSEKWQRAHKKEYRKLYAERAKLVDIKFSGRKMTLSEKRALKRLDMAIDNLDAKDPLFVEARRQSEQTRVVLREAEEVLKAHKTNDIRKLIRVIKKVAKRMRNFKK